MNVHHRGERGAVTAETAVVLPLVAAFSLAMAWLVSLGVAQARTVDAAREVARVVARGESPAQARSWGERIAPEGARFRIAGGADEVVVRVAAPIDGPGGLFGFLPGITVRAQAVAAPEPSGGDR